MTTQPEGLGAGGARLWEAASAAYQFDPAEAELLRAACRLVDQLERLNGALAEAEPMVTGSTGQPRPNPLFDEVRRHSETLARVTAALALPDGSASVSSSERGRAAASARWAKTGTKRSA